MLSDLWGAPPGVGRRSKFGDWVTDASHIRTERVLPSQIYRRAFQYTPRDKLADVVGPRNNEFVPWASLLSGCRGVSSRTVQPFNVYVHREGTEDDSDVFVRVSPHETVGQVKARLQRALGIPVETQRLMFGGQGLQDGRVMAACRVPDGGELLLCDAPSPPRSAPRSRTTHIKASAWPPSPLSTPHQAGLLPERLPSPQTVCLRDRRMGFP